MKKSVFIALIAIVVVGLAGAALAATPVAITNGELNASYLVWPKIVTTAEADTVITIYNDSSSGALLHCYWMNEEQYWLDFEFEITRRQVVWFKASDGLINGSLQATPFPGEYGELKCWAVTEDDLPLTNNSFTGTGTIFNFVDGTAIGYNAYGFRRSGAPGIDSVLTLDGAEYDNCPAYLLGTFMLQGASFEDNGYTVTAGTTDLTLVPCEQDLREEQLPIYVKVNFTVWNEDEVGATGAYLCFKCWIETTLTDPPVATLGLKKYKGFQNFTTDAIGGTFATVKITPQIGGRTSCGFTVDSPKVPVIGLLFGATEVGGKYASSGSILQSAATAFAGTAPRVQYDQLEF